MQAAEPIQGSAADISAGVLNDKQTTLVKDDLNCLNSSNVTKFLTEDVNRLSKDLAGNDNCVLLGGKILYDPHGGLVILIAVIASEMRALESAIIRGLLVSIQIVVVIHRQVSGSG
jgi:hypothetical protein